MLAATHFEVVAPPSAAQGVAFMVTVRALDQNNMLVSDYSGTVHFSSTDSAAVLPADTMQTGGSAMYPVTLNTLGNWTISAMDATNNLSGTSNSIAVAAATTTTIISTPNPSAVGQTVTFTATVSSTNPAAGTPTGSVQFFIDGATFGSPITLSASGVATITDSALSVGMHTVTATYNGDSSHAASTSAPLTQTVLSVEEQLQIIRDQVKSLELNKGNQNSLLVKLNLKGNHGDIGKVGAFIHHVNAFRKAGKISPTDADMLISEAKALLISLRFEEASAAHTHGHSQAIHAASAATVHGNGQAKHAATAAVVHGNGQAKHHA